MVRTRDLSHRLAVTNLHQQLRTIIHYYRVLGFILRVYGTCNTNTFHARRHFSTCHALSTLRIHDRIDYQQPPHVRRVRSIHRHGTVTTPLDAFSSVSLQGPHASRSRLRSARWCGAHPSHASRSRAPPTVQYTVPASRACADSVTHDTGSLHPGAVHGRNTPVTDADGFFTCTHRVPTSVTPSRTPYTPGRQDSHTSLDGVRDRPDRQ